MFITFEGIEGAGKSTQISKVAAYLEAKGYKTLITKEPGGTRIGELLRALLINPDNKDIHQKTELLLFTADRVQHVETTIKPALKTGNIVLCDRYTDSTIAYQVWGRQNSKQLVTTLNKIVNLEPDLTFLLDINPEEGIKRAKNRAKLDRFEKEKLEFHHRVRAGYMDIYQKQKNRMRLINASGDTEKVFKIIKKALSIILTEQ